MVTVEVRRTPQGKIREIRIEGHAGYGPEGEDLVCAGISAITFGAANAMEVLLQVDPVKKMGESGFLHFDLPQGIKREEEAQLLLEAMLLSLRTMEESYSKYIRVNDEKRVK